MSRNKVERVRWDRKIGRMAVEAPSLKRPMSARSLKLQQHGRARGALSRCFVADELTPKANFRRSRSTCQRRDADQQNTENRKPVEPVGGDEEQCGSAALVCGEGYNNRKIAMVRMTMRGLERR